MRLRFSLYLYNNMRVVIIFKTSHQHNAKFSCIDKDTNLYEVYS